MAYLRMKRKSKKKNKKNSQHKQKKERFIFHLRYKNGNGIRVEKFFSIEFPYAEAGIRWTNEKRKIIKILYSKIFPEHPENISLRFLDKGQYPSPRRRVKFIKEPENLTLAQIFELTSK